MAPTRTLPAAWAAQWRAHPDKPILQFPDTQLTGADLATRTATSAGRLAGAGVRAGDRVVLAARTSPVMVVAYCALVRMGCVVVPVNPAYTEREVRVIVEDARPAAAVIESAAMRAWVDAPIVTDADVTLPDAAPPELDAVTPDAPALLPYTSGTTGRPKGALLSHGNLIASAEAVRAAWRWTADDTLILCLPLFHVHGLGVGLHGTLLCGASAIVQPSFDPAAVVAAAADATMFFGVPTMYARLVDTEGAAQLRRLRLCVSGSAPLAASLHDRMRAVCGQEVLERYGMTETLMLVSNPYDGERRPGTVGFPLPGVELRLDPGGQILVRGPSVFRGYWDRPDATAQAFTADGWFQTGDIGEIDADGYLRIVGRAKELIITGGFNVYPREIEDVLRTHPTVIDAAVVGTPSDEWGEVVTAYVEATDDFDAHALLAWAADQFVAYKRPRLVHRVDALPRNALGKVQRDKLSA